MAVGTKILVAMRSWVEEQLAALRAWAEASLSNKANAIITETNEPLDKMREFGWYAIQAPSSGYPPGYTTDSFFALFVSGRDIAWSPWLLMDLRTGATFRGGYSVGQFMPWEPLVTATLPEEHDLPLAEGVIHNRKTCYIKEQNGRIKLRFCVMYPPAETRTVIIGTLPHGYRSIDIETSSCTITEAEGDVMGPGTVEVLTNGTVRVYANKAGTIGAVGSIEFPTY